jgi:SAM-dependent methyltransferase
MNKNDVYWYNFGKEGIQKFWERNGGKPDLQEKICCDIGCGYGSLCIDMALSGAKKVIGYDIDNNRIAFAQENLKTKFPQLIGVVEFYCDNFIEASLEEQFDIITSKDSFEHIVDLQKMLDAIRLRMKTNALFYVGFGPLFYSFYGGHQFIRTIPWIHLFSKKSFLRNMGLNGYTLSYYEKLFKNSGLEIKSLEINQGKKLKLLKFFNKIPFLRELFAHNCYVTLINSNAGR